jgi:ABC-type nickel/cobalt efflux system permease component RcnA
LIRGKIFNKISKISNWILVVAGIFLLVYQLNGYFTDSPGHPHNQEDSREDKKENLIESDTDDIDTNDHNHNHDHGHSHDHTH